MIQQQEQDYLNAVRQWLLEFGISAELIANKGYSVLKTEHATLVLDYMHLPYQKPSVSGFHFGIDYFLFHREALKSRIASIMLKTKVIFARNCVVRRIDKKTALDFFSRNHLSGYSNAKFKYGLYYKSELIAAITFAPGRNIIRNTKKLRSFELIGFCQSSGKTVTGGLSKLINAFVVDKSPNHIATTVDLDWATGNALIRLGFTQTSVSNPLCYTVDWENGERKFPSRSERVNNSFSADEFPYQNAGFAKFEHFYTL